MIRQRFVIDTSALTDSQTREIEGGTLCVAMGGILDIIAEARLHLGISCYIPFPSVYNEMRDFAKNNGCDEDVLAKIDTWLNRALRKPMVIEFWGSDIRSPSVETQRNPYYPGAQHYGESDNRSEKLLRSWARLTGGVAVVSDHLFNAQLQAHFPTIYIVGQRCDIASVIPTYPSVDARRQRIVHAPSHRAVKGTEHLERALERLRTLGLHFDYIRIENMSHDEATTAYRSADLIVDQLCLGAHGIFACEAMALGKPVICYTLDEAAAGYPSGLPLINANPDTIERVLEQWLADGAARHAAGVRSRAYAERVHDYLLVGRRLAAIYCNHLANTHPKGINDWRERNFTDSNSNR